MVEIAEDETIHTDSSHKMTAQEFLDLAAPAGWRPERSWTDGSYVLHLLAAA